MTTGTRWFPTRLSTFPKTSDWFPVAWTARAIGTTTPMTVGFGLPMLSAAGGRTIAVTGLGLTPTVGHGSPPTRGVGPRTTMERGRTLGLVGVGLRVRRFSIGAR